MRKWLFDLTSGADPLQRNSNSFTLPVSLFPRSSKIEACYMDRKGGGSILQVSPMC